MNINPLDRTRPKNDRAIEEANNCSAITVYAEDGSVAVLPNPCLRGAILNSDKLILAHSFAVIEATGPEAILSEGPSAHQ